MPILDLFASSRKATDTFHTFDDQEPDLIPTGIAPVDRVIGGLFAGNTGVLAAATGVGKSSALLSAALAAEQKVPVGIVSLEDGADVLGTRALAFYSGVDSLAIRRKALSPSDKRKIERAQERLAEKRIHIAYEIGSPLQKLQESIERLGALGCRLIYFDYIQKVRGHKEDRRNEVASAFSALQGTCANIGAAGIFISQFSRQDSTKVPQISWLKESGDLENEARLIILMHRDDKNRLHGRIAKSTFGGEHVTFVMVRDESGTLRELSEEEFDF